ncbi:MAG: UDP-3-O-acyl-N-acetylglucosamine deacetylase [Holosporales bacterium]
MKPMCIIMKHRTKLLPIRAHDALLNHQATLGAAISFTGIGVHSARDITITLLPSDEDTGIVFVRTDLNHPHNRIPALYDHVSSTTMSTTLTNSKGISVSTVEHLMAALCGLKITNCKILIDGPELPIMDGSSRPFCEGILQVGTHIQTAKKPTIRILKRIRIEGKNSFAEFIPFDTSAFEMTFDFYGRMPQEYRTQKPVFFDLDDDSFFALVSHARTFGFYEDGKMLQDRGLAKGASLDNTIIIKDNAILNPEGLRHVDEFVQHKILDAVGDLSLSPFKIVGLYRSYNGSHTLNNQLLHTLYQTPDAFGFDELPFL